MCSLCPVISKNTYHPPPHLIVVAGAELAEASSSSLVMIVHSTKEIYKQHYPSSLIRYWWIGIFSIVQDSPLLPPVEVRIPMHYTLGARQATFTLGASFPSTQLPEHNVQLACVKRITNIPSEAGSNSSCEYDWAL
ncbi:hypothetical protein KIW84_012946 [Lathyrus oleraceus]|uniref:Uncharacterized protein n=1 Tax=Pisum sativum TaxID=3888 RepID=A0A9D5BJ52_PEA|nr:hypothetical protein KIW84_012946 [Pisum sativum]